MKRLLDEPALRSLARGCAVLGTGGGGDPHIGLLLALQALEEVGPTELVDLDDLPDDALIMPCGMVGAPTVHIEKIENGGEGAVLREHLERLTGRQVAALMPAEIGGSNGLLPAVLGRADGPAGRRRRRHGPGLPGDPAGHDASSRDRSAAPA